MIELTSVKPPESESSKGSEPTSSTSSSPTPAGTLTVRRPRSPLVVLAGALTVTGGILALFNGLTVFFGESSSTLFDIDIGVNRYVVCGSMIIAFGVVAVAGGLSALLGKSMSLAFAGAALCMMGDGLPGFWFGLISIALLFFSDEDF